MRLDRLATPRDRTIREAIECDDPERAEQIEARARRTEDELAPARAERERARDASAVRVGRADAPSLLAAAGGIEPWAFLDDFERNAVAPLDDAIAADTAWLGGERAHGAASDLRRAALGHHAGRLVAARIPTLLRRLGGCLGLDPDADRGPRIGVHPARTASFAWSVPVPRVEIAAWHGGPGGVRDALGAFARATRFAFVRRTRGTPAAFVCDPAFAAAVEILFRRLTLAAEFADWAGLADRPVWIADARREAAIEPRVEWALAASARDPVEKLPDEAAARLRRACGRAVSAFREGAAWARGLDPIDRLRGTVLALLVEEAVLTRFGRRWFVDRAAGRWLRDRWESEPDANAGAMAASIGGGRMEPTPVLDRCRP